LSTATGGRRSRRTPGRRGGQLVLAGQNDRKPPTNRPEEPNFLSSDVGLLTALAAIGVIATFAASLLLAREASMAVSAFNDEMKHRRAQRPPTAH